MTNTTFDNSIPELTEVLVAEATPVVTPPAAPAAGFRATRRITDTTPEPSVTVEQVSPHALSDWTDEEWHRLETEIRERIARQVLGRIDFVLEQRVRDSLADVLQTAVGSLADEIKQGLQNTLEDVIGRAVAQEITRLKTTKN